MDFTKRESGVLVPSEPAPPPPAPMQMASNWPQATLADWDRFRNCNHERIDHCQIARFGGGLHFGWHVGKKLSQGLWVDLVHRLGIRSLWIIDEHQGEWTVARIDRYATIYIDEHGSDIVQDISIGGF